MSACGTAWPLPDHLLQRVNVTQSNQAEIRKRAGYVALGSAGFSSPGPLATFNDELLQFGDAGLKSYDNQTDSWFSHASSSTGQVRSPDISLANAYSDNHNQSDCDSATYSNCTVIAYTSTFPSRSEMTTSAVWPGAYSVIIQLICLGRIRGQTLQGQRALYRYAIPNSTGVPPSFSSRTIVYKGLLLATQVGSFYDDLRNRRTIAYTTVQTMVYRLEAKKALRRARKIGNPEVPHAGAESRAHGRVESDHQRSLDQPAD